MSAYKENKMKRLFLVLVLLILPFTFVLADVNKETDDFNVCVFLGSANDEEVGV